MKKTTLISVLALLLAFVLVGCGSGNAEPEQAEETMPVAQATQATEPPQPTQETEPTIPPDPIDLLSDRQRNVLAMYNHLAVITYEINDTDNGRMFLEEVYNAIMGNTNPEVVDERTKEYLMKLLNVIENYRMILLKRERIQYIFEQNKAEILKDTVPEPTSLIANATTLNVVGLASTAIGSFGSYQNSIDLLSQEYLQDGWALDDEERKNLHESRTEFFQYLLETVREEQIPKDMVLSEEAVREFAKWKNEDNIYQRLRFFESGVETYKYYAGYWQELVACYYEVGDYENCLRAMDEYEHIREDLFFKDFYLAQTLPMAVVSAHELYDTEEYTPVAERYLELLTDNALNSDWSVRYFAAQMYIDLYNKVGDESYLQKALEIEIDNVNHLIQGQREMNSDYVSGIKHTEDLEENDGNKIKLISDFMDYLNNLRTVELPPVYEPLTVNCDLMFALAEKLEVSQEKQKEIEGILRGSGDPLFLSEALESQYSFASGDLLFAAEFKKDTLVLPVSCVSENTAIRISVTTDGTTTVYEDWVVKKVDRPSEDFASFIVTYASELIKEQIWNGDSTVKVEIIVDVAYPDNVIVLSFDVISYVDLWLIPDSVEFAQANS